MLTLISGQAGLIFPAYSHVTASEFNGHSARTETVWVANSTCEKEKPTWTGGMRQGWGINERDR
jgi:hypothetical protein